MELSNYLYIFLITCFFSFGVQSLFYIWYRRYYPKHTQLNKHVYLYLSGVVGDGVLVPMINIFAFLSFDTLTLYMLDNYIICFSVLGGFIITFLFHYAQEYFNLINWTMPATGKWNNLGLYHALFMFFESSFLVFTLLIFIQNIRIHEVHIMSNIPILYGVAALLVFLLCMIFDYWHPLFKHQIRTLGKMIKN